MSKIFLTGITGLVGSAFVSELLRQRDDVEIICLTRKGGAPSAQERVKNILKEQCEFDGHPESITKILSKVAVIEGDVTTIDPAALAADERLKGVDTIFHCAADVNLGKDPEGRVFRINYDGTLKILELANLLKVKALHYVSTAYIAGRLCGRAMEDSPIDSGFYNPYEESKFKAEQAVRNSGIPFTIYRPSIIVGRRNDGRIRKPLAFYRILEFIGKLKAHACQKRGLDYETETDLKIYFQAGASQKIYFVPIDYVQYAVTALFQKPVENRAYHITGDSPVSTHMIDRTVTNVLHVKKMFYEEGQEHPGDIVMKDVRLAERLLGDLFPYFETNITFDQSNVRSALGDQALDWTFGDAELTTMVRSFYQDFFPNVPWLQKLIAER